MRHTHHAIGATLAALGLVGLFMSSGCQDNGVATVSSASANSGDAAVSSHDASATDGDAGSEPPRDLVAPCKSAVDGTKCGSAGEHCVQHHCIVNVCGDHLVAGNEECDDGNVVALDGCDPECRKEKSACGDGRIGVGEECDDRNKVNDDACSNLCTKNVCGNGRIDLREECDDGNTVDTDACSNACALNICGNGRVDPGEECDDGNKNDNDGCTNLCVIARCGNGKKELKEECDDGNSVDTDTCSNVCALNACGNGRVDPGEKCDGTVVGLECTDQCKTVNDVCTPCEVANCSDYLGLGSINLVAACYHNADPTFVQKCVDVIACARQNNCAYTSRGAEQCYCGTATSADCALAKGVDGKCKAEFEAAAKSPDPVYVTHHFSDRGLPLGNAVFMLNCDRDSCGSTVQGHPCTP